MSETKMTDTELKEWLDAKLYVTAHHEAGHVVAAVMVDGKVENLWINDGPDAENWGNCRSAMPTRIGARGFNVFAGPCADARARWPEGVPLDGVDADGLMFMQRIGQDFAPDHWEDGDYGEFDLAELGELDAEPELGAVDLETYLWIWDSDDHSRRAGDEAYWLRRLETLWPVIQALATHLLDVRGMDGDAVHAFVEPMLEGVSA